MGTRSSIGIQNENGTVDSIYCHWDGCPSHHAPILLKHYTSESKVRKLIKYGDMSSLRPDISPRPGTHHSFDKPQGNVCIYYHRDRGEEWNDTKPVRFGSISDWQKAAPGRGQYIGYLFKNNKWYFADELYECPEKQLQELTEDFDQE